MQIIFAGTPEFASYSLQKIYNSKHQIVGVFTQPDKKSGRGKKLTESKVKEFAKAHNLAIYQPKNLKNKEVIQWIKDLKPDVIVVAAYGQILSQELLDIPQYGCLNIHASLLPRWRGAAPIQRAILMGDKITGINIIKMDKGLDTGQILLEKTCIITIQDNAKTLHNKLAILGGEAILKALDNITNLSPKAQIGSTIYAQKLNKNEAEINWSQSAKKINQQIRAFNPYPIARTTVSTDKFISKSLMILQAEVVKDINCDIFVDKNNLIIQTKNQALSLKTVQLSGKKAITIKDFNNAYKNFTLKASDTI